MTRSRHTQFFRSALLLSISAALVGALGCGSDGSPTGSDEPPGNSGDIAVDEGFVGVVIDTRSIVRKGYLPATLELGFPAHARFDTTLTVDPTTNLAIWNVHRTELTTAEETSLGNGVEMTVRVLDGSGTELVSTTESNWVVDDSNTPLEVSTTLPKIDLPTVLRPGLPFLIHPEGSSGVLTSDCSDCYTPEPYAPGAVNQQFTFEVVPGAPEHTYYIHHEGHNEGNNWYAWTASGQWVVGLRGGSSNPGEPEEFELVFDDPVWFRIRHVPTGLFVYQDTIDLRLNNQGDRYRLISDAVDWQVEDRGTVFNQPVMPPAQLNFAFDGVLRNCSSAELAQTAGTETTVSRTTTIGTTESFQLFSSSTSSIALTVGVEVTGKIGTKTPGTETSQEVTLSEQISLSRSYTTSQTTSSSNTWSESKTTQETVFNSRTVTVPPFTVVEVRDLIKKIPNVRVPFTQVLRIRGTDSGTGTSLSGEEIVGQLVFNFFGGVVQTIGADYVDISLRGMATIDNFYKASTRVDEVENGCS